jgi:hypothetical protein
MEMTPLEKISQIQKWGFIPEFCSKNNNEFKSLSGLGLTTEKVRMWIKRGRIPPRYLFYDEFNRMVGEFYDYLIEKNQKKLEVEIETTK